MAQDVIDRTIGMAELPLRTSVTSELRLHGWTPATAGTGEWRDVYGADLPRVEELAKSNAELGELLHSCLPFRKAEVVWAAKFEMARTVEDVLARRTRALFLDARASLEAAAETARLLAGALGRDEQWQQQQVKAFKSVAQNYIWTGE
jgi:glycerol-3-phosphate dehydrogenase